MRKTVIKYAVVIALVVGSGALLMNISQHVQRAEREIKIYDRKIARKEEALRVLKAEWAYLNNPARLELLASKGLDLATPDAQNIISDIPPEKELSSPSLIAPANHLTSPILHHNISYSNNNDNGGGQ